MRGYAWRRPIRARCPSPRLGRPCPIGICWTAVLLWGLWMSPLACGQAAGLTPEQIREISRVASAALEASHLPGLSVAVSKDDRIWSAGFGQADLEQNVPVTPQSLFRTASIGKWFTATAAMRLVEDGKLDLDAPIQQYCPQFPLKPWRVTSRQLLSHMGGLRHNYGDNGEKRDTQAERLALEELMRRERITQYTRYTDVIQPLEVFKDDPLLFQPGTAVHYSSLGYRLMGCVLQGAAQTPYRKLMRDLVFVPAGMSTIREDDALAIVAHRAGGYSRDADGTIVRAAFRDVSENLAAGGWLSTPEDLVRFVLAFQSGRLVKWATRDQMVAHPQLIDGTPAPNPLGDPRYYYGIGVMVGPDEGPSAWFHTGGQSGASALLFWFPQSQVAVALMTNLDGSAIRESLARRIAAIAAQCDPVTPQCRAPTRCLRYAGDLASGGEWIGRKSSKLKRGEQSGVTSRVANKGRMLRFTCMMSAHEASELTVTLSQRAATPGEWAVLSSPLPAGSSAEKLASTPGNMSGPSGRVQPMDLTTRSRLAPSCCRIDVICACRASHE
jgi:serine beta-lactamase-like protein LACTB